MMKERARAGAFLGEECDDDRLSANDQGFRRSGNVTPGTPDNKEMQAYLAAIVDSSEDAIIGKDVNGSITSWNSSATRIFGYSRDEAIGRHISMIIPPDRLDEEARIIAQIRNGKRVSHFETVRRHKDGHLVDISVSVSPILDTEGKVIGASKVARDISEYKRVIAELKRSNEELEKFAHVAAHDLKSPLRGIDNLARWILEDNQDTLSPEATKMLTMLLGRVGRLERFLDDILAYARAGHVDETVADIDVGGIISEIAQSQIPPAFTLRIPGPLPRIHGLATPLRQVFGNLISNAVKHHDLGSGVIDILARRDGAFYEFIVHDDGPGIPEDAQERVFQMFQTLRPRDEVEGSGMGMAIVKKLVEWQGGRVWITSKTGERGTAVHFLWPAEASTTAINNRRNKS